MSLTRAQVDALMVRRLGRSLNFWGLDGDTVDGTNPDVAAALGRALMALDIAVADPLAPSDAELLLLSNSAWPALLDTVHLHLLEACLDNADVVREREGVNEQEWNGRVAELRKRYEDKRGELAVLHGDYVAGPTGGTLTLGYVQPEPEDARDDDDA